MLEENVNFEEVPAQLSSRTLGFYGTHQQENKSKILYTGGNEYLVHLKNEKIQAKYIFHVCFQLSSLIDYVSNYFYNILFIAIKFIRSK